MNQFNFTDKNEWNLYAQYSGNGDNQFTFFNSYFEFLLNEQYEKTSTEITNAWLKCNETYKVPFDEAIDIFQNPPRGDERFMSREAKCLVDCTMRNTGVVSGKLKVSSTARMRFFYHFSILFNQLSDDGFNVPQYMTHVKQLRFNYTSFDINNRPQDSKREMLMTIWKRSSGCGSYATILNYSWAARQCSDVRDPNGDR